MLPMTFSPVLRELAVAARTAFSAAEAKTLRRLRVFSRPAPVRIKVHSPTHAK
jgi:hypothetical protein